MRSISAEFKLSFALAGVLFFLIVINNLIGYFTLAHFRGKVAQTKQIAELVQDQKVSFGLFVLASSNSAIGLATVNWDLLLEERKSVEFEIKRFEGLKDKIHHLLLQHGDSLAPTLETWNEINQQWTSLKHLNVAILRTEDSELVNNEALPVFIKARKQFQLLFERFQNEIRNAVDSRQQSVYKTTKYTAFLNIGVQIIALPLLVFFIFMPGMKRAHELEVRTSEVQLARDLIREQQITLLKAQSLAKLGVWKWRAGDELMTWSEEMTNVLGLPVLTTPSYANLIEKVYAEDRAHFEEAIAACQKSHEEHQAEFRCQTETGIRHFSLLCHSESASETSTVPVLGIIQDITAQKMGETLRSERDAAEKANQSKSLFLANMSHELRTPMHGIMSFARFGQRKDDSTIEQLRSYFDEIHDSGTRLMSLLNDLLDLSKLEAGKMEIALEETNLVSVIDSVASEMSAFVTEKGLTLEFAPSSQEVIGIFDSQKISQVVRNLLSNAIKFSETGSVVKLDTNSSDGQLWCHVTNKGIGIPQDELQTIFDKFVQSSKTKSGAGGTGLGLAISREIIRGHGGKIWAENTPAGETRFVFSILITPVAKAA